MSAGNEARRSTHWPMRTTIALTAVALAGVGYFAYGGSGSPGRAPTSAVDIKTIGRGRLRLRIIIAVVALAIAAGGFLAYGSLFGDDGTGCHNTHKVSRHHPLTVTMSAAADRSTTLLLRHCRQ
jgi:hypothetical protein